MTTLIKDGKVFNLKTSTLLAVSQWWMCREVRRTKLYKTKLGTFFLVEEYAEVRKSLVQMKDGSEEGIGYVCHGEYCLTGRENGYSNNVQIESMRIIDILTEKEVRAMYDWMPKGYMDCNKVTYTVLVDYVKLFGKYIKA